VSLRTNIESIFSRDGALSRVLDRFEWRGQQIEMARAVALALERSETLIVEAPTGVGKSLAYLIPGAIWARQEGKVLLVSTHTKNLQDQVLRRDFPHLARLSDRKITAAVLKGRANYLCRRRWEIARADLEGTTDGEALVRLLEGWVQLTESGDFDEGPPVPPRLRSLLSRISSESRFCSSSACTADDGCFYKLSRRRAREANVVLINHALLVLEILSDGIGLPEADALVIDEAHNLPGIAADQLERRISSRGWSQVLLGLGGQGEPGASDRMRRILRGWPSRIERAKMIARIREMELQLGVLLEDSKAWFDALRRSEGYPRGGGRARYRLGAGSGGSFPEWTYSLLDRAGDLVSRHENLAGEVGAQVDTSVRDGELREVEGPIMDARAAVQRLTALVEADDSGAVYWIEDDAHEGPILRSRPLELARSLGDRLATGRAVILTSATLAADGSTAFFASECGLPEDTPSLVLPPVFDLDRQVLGLVPQGIHDPTHLDHGVDLAEGITRLAARISRKMLVLFTAHETLRRVEERIRPQLEDRGIKVFAQGREASRQALTAAFQMSDRAVLLGAASFWEGVDFPGDDLEILVMVRLPFPVPTDPFVEAYSERMREEGRDPFASFMLPEAIVRFRQGFGRLIRSREDRGVFVVLDPRILKRGYGTRFRDAIGIPLHAVDSWDDLIERAEGWFSGRG
jgi:ATP-dependent DNA helicase DinG